MIVMKFGGTSVQDAKAIERVAHIVQGRLADRPVVVVSAMAKVTDALLSMGKAAGGGDRKTALKMARALRERHYDTSLHRISWRPRSRLRRPRRIVAWHRRSRRDYSPHL
jgi:aspartokinase